MYGEGVTILGMQVIMWVTISLNWVCKLHRNTWNKPQLCTNHTVFIDIASWPWIVGEWQVDSKSSAMSIASPRKPDTIHSNKIHSLWACTTVVFIQKYTKNEGFWIHTTNNKDFTGIASLPWIVGEWLVDSTSSTMSNASPQELDAIH